MMQHRNQGGAEVCMHHSNIYKAFMPRRGWLWCLTGLENDKLVVKRTGVVGHKSLSTKRLVVESLSDRDFYLQSIANMPFSNIAITESHNLRQL